jgi:hypothetical protein
VDIEFTEDGSAKDSSIIERYSSETPPIEDYLSDEDEVDLPIRIKMSPL